MDYLDIIKKIEQETGPKSSQEWLAVWRELAEVSSGLTRDDPRLEPVMRWLNVCDVAFSLDSWPGFCEAAERVREIMRGRA
jgi:hypothetical protein